jgi:colicin import membrane protein
MKAGFSTSLVLHALVLGVGLVTLTAPKPHEVGDVMALPVDIVPIESLTELQQGDKTVKEKAEKPAPKPTKRQDPTPEAKNAGENDVDLEDVPRPEPKPQKVETAAAPKAEPAPKPDPVPTEAKPEPKPEPKVAEAKPEPKPEPKPVEAKPEPKPEPKPDPIAEAINAEPQPTEQLEFPDELPKPEKRPEREQQVAKAETKPEPKTEPDKTAEKSNEKAKKTEKTSKAAKEQDLESLLDETKALLDKQKPAGGGAKRSERQAALGNDRPATGAKLSVSEMDALRQRLAGCWSIPAGVDDAELLKVSVRFRLDRSGELEARPEIIKGGGSSGPARTAAESAVRAVSKCAPFNLPADKYDTWAEVVVNFDPTDMF